MSSSSRRARPVLQSGEPLWGFAAFITIADLNYPSLSTHCSVSDNLTIKECVRIFGTVLVAQWLRK